MRFILRLLLNAGVFLGVSHFLSGFHVTTFTAALIAALAFGVVNALIRPLLILVTLPATILTLGLFTLLIDGAVMALTAFLVPGFTIDGLFPAVVGWILVSIGGWLTAWLTEKK